MSKIRSEISGDGNQGNVINKEQVSRGNREGLTKRFNKAVEQKPMIPGSSGGVDVYEKVESEYGGDS